jgi:hypothetical protein
MLDLDDPRWGRLQAHFDNAGADGILPAVPTLLRAWHDAVGSYGEEFAYVDLRESYLHQGTILSVAYAVVPHLASRLHELDPDRALAVADDVALVEEARLVPREDVEAAAAELEAKGSLLHRFLAANVRDRHPLLPDDLAATYLLAVETTRASAGGLWGQRAAAEPGDHQVRRHVRFLRAHGWSDADLVEAVRRQRPPGAHQAPVFRGPQASLDALAGMPAAEGLTVDDLPFRALFALAWLPPATWSS